MSRQLVIFDMDGTLVDSEPCAAQAIVDVIGSPLITQEQILLSYRGMKLSSIFDDIEARYNLPLPADVVKRYRQREHELSHTLIKPNPAVAHVLSRLDQHCCIASNAPIEKTRRSLHACGLAQYITGNVYSAYDVQAWKPEPDLFLHAASEEQYEAEQCIVVEDSDAGISAALAAGMQPIFYNPHQRSSEHHSVYSISCFTQLLELLPALADAPVTHSGR